jgi:hypothetical protein
VVGESLKTEAKKRSEELKPTVPASAGRSSAASSFSVVPSPLRALPARVFKVRPAPMWSTSPLAWTVMPLSPERELLMVRPVALTVPRAVSVASGIDIDCALW